MVFSWVGPKGGEMGLRGKRCFRLPRGFGGQVGASDAGISVKKTPNLPQNEAELKCFMTLFIECHSSPPDRLAKIFFFGSGFF